MIQILFEINHSLEEDESEKLVKEEEAEPISGVESARKFERHLLVVKALSLISNDANLTRLTWWPVRAYEILLKALISRGNHFVDGKFE